MKKLKIILTVFLFLMLQASFGFAYNGYDVQVLKSNGLNIELEFTLMDYSFEDMILDDDDDDDDKTFTMIKFSNSVKTSQKGFAELPKLFTALALPGRGNVRAELVSSEYKEVTLKHALLPSRGTIYRNQDIDAIPYEIAPSSITDAWYPGEVINTKAPFIFRDVRGVTVYAHPFQYNATSKTVRVHEKMIVRLTGNRSATINELPSSRGTVSREMNSIYHDLFLNYAVDSTRAPLQLGEMGDILVLHTSRDANTIKPYIQWKREKGFNVTTQQVSAGTNVKSTIKTAYNGNKNLLYVQLVGDWADIKSDLGGGANAPMDPMLGCVVGTDNYADIIIGRFSANSAADVTTQVNKAINYEKNTSGSWYKNGLGIASSEGGIPGKGDDGESDFAHMGIIKNNRLLKSSYTTVHEIYKTGSASTVSGYVNQGLGVINYVGHGSETAWSTTGFSNSDISGLTNGDRLPFIFSVACVNGAFHRAGGDCFGEAWLKKQDGGAVATVMSTINQPWDPPMRGQDYMNDILIGGYNYNSNPGSGTNVTEGRTTFGSIVFNGMVLMYAESSKPADLQTIQTWTIFGDASVQVRRDTPITISLSNKTIASGTPFTTKVTTGGSGVENAIVSLYQNDKVFSGQTNTNGSVTINHQFTSGTLTLTASGFNLATSSEQITIGGGGNQPPQAKFSFRVNGSTVNFTDESTDLDGTISAWSWDFGDNQNSTQQNPSNTYSKDGNYRVTLTVTDNKQATDSITKNIQIGNTPQQFNLVVTKKGQGAVTLDPPSGKYDPNTKVTLTATAAKDWKFTGWSGDLSGSVNPETITITANKNVTATFTNSTPPPDSCEGHCGNKAPSGCWCDSQCEQYGDCCSDKKQFCGF